MENKNIIGKKMIFKGRNDFDKKLNKRLTN
jgi:hypothetical protein